MLKKEDIENLMGKQEDLHPDLVDHIDHDSPLGNFLKHPLYLSVYDESMNAYINTAYLSKKAQADKTLKDKDWKQWIWLHERPFRLDAFLYVSQDLPAKKYWNLLRDIWIDTEGPSVNQDIWLQLFARRYPGRRKMMTGKERRAFHKATPTLEINNYRGFGQNPDDEINREQGMSWTLSYEKAEWFAKRFMTDVGASLDRDMESDIKPMVAEAICQKENVIAYFDYRGEQEIVIDPANIRILRTQETL